MKLYKQLGYILALAIGSSAANASVDLVNTLTGNESGGRFNFPAGFPDISVATQFSTSDICPQTCALGDVTLFLGSDDINGIGHGPATAGSFTLEILADNSDAPGTSIATMINPTFIVETVANNIFTAPAGITLLDDTNYWLRLTSSGNSPEEVDWLYGSGGPGNWQYQSLAGLETSQTNPHSTGMMRIEAVPEVPVPSAFWLLGTALIGLVTRRSKK
jgi:hypothetical protein